MSEEQTKALRPLRWRFWLVLFAPAIITMLGTACLARLHGGLAGVTFVNLCLGPAVNFVCSIKAARIMVSRNDHRTRSNPWMFFWTPLFFFLNVAIVFGGCVLAQNMGR